MARNIQRMPADQLPTPYEELQQETQAAEEELTKVREQIPEPEELAEESLPSEDEGEEEAEPDQPEESKPEVEEQESESPEDVPQDLSRRGQERFKELTSRLKQTSAERDQLKTIVQELQSQGYSKQQAQDLAPQLDIDPNQDPQAYAQQVAYQARQAARQEIEQERMLAQHQQKVERFQEDLQTIEKEYEVLNEDSPEYDEKLSNFVAEVFESRSSKDPKVRLVDVTKEIMEVRNKGAEEAVAKQGDKIRKKAASQALPSSGGKGTMRSLADQLKEVDSERELMELRKQIPLGD